MQYLYLERKEHLSNSWIFLIYTHKDKSIADWFIEKINEKSQIQHIIIRDVDKLVAGDDFIKNLEQLYDKSYAAIALITNNVIKKCKSWVFYEIGVFKGQKKHIIPYVPKDCPFLTKESIPKLEKLPDFLRRFQLAQSVDDVIKVLNSSYPSVKFLKQIKTTGISPEEVDINFFLNFQINIPKIEGYPLKNFNMGVQIIRFGHPEWIKSNEDKYTSEFKRLQITLKILSNWKEVDENLYTIPNWFKISSFSIVEDKENYNTYRISFPIPIHKRYGVTFKIFLDIENFLFIKKKEVFIRQLKEYNDDLIEDVSISISRFYSSRVYILLKETIPIRIVDEVTDNIRNNYIYPQ